MIARLIALAVAVRAAWHVLRGRPVTSRTAAGSNGHRAPDDPSAREVPANPRGELWVALLLFAAAGCALGFIALYVVETFNTQLLGIAMGACLMLFAAAAILLGKIVVPQETSVEPRGALYVPVEAEEVSELVREGGEGVSRRRLLTCAGCAAGGALAVAAAAPLASLGPPPRALHVSPWRRGVRFVDEDGAAITADDIQIGSFYTALPEGGDPEAFGAGLLVIRLPESMIDLPRSRSEWTPGGIMAFSKICPHAGCAISLYRYPLYAPTSTDRPAFTCPCHYSTFTPADGGHVIFGPAGRSLPQLPVTIGPDRQLVAGGEFDSDVGPSWWGVRRT